MGFQNQWLVWLPVVYGPLTQQLRVCLLLSCTLNGCPMVAMRRQRRWMLPFGCELAICT